MKLRKTLVLAGALLGYLAVGWVAPAVAEGLGPGECHLECEVGWRACVDRARTANEAARCEAAYKGCVARCGNAVRAADTKVWKCDGRVECSRGEDQDHCDYRDKTAYAETADDAVEGLRALCEAGYNVGPGGWSCKATTLACEER